MKRNLQAVVLLAALGGFSGCMSDGGGGGGGDGGPMPGGGGPSGPGQYMNSYRNDQRGNGLDSETHSGAYQMATVPGLMGPDGVPIPRTAPYATATSAGEAAARATLLANASPEMIAQAGLLKNGKIGGEINQVCYQCGPNGCPAQGMGSPLMPTGFQGGPGPVPSGPPNPYGPNPPGAVAAVGALTGGGGPFSVQRTSVRFVEPAGMRITWFAPTPDGKAGFGPNYLEAPARYNFSQACIYRLKISDIPNRPGLELYPTLEVVPTNARTATFLAHSAVPLAFTQDDFAQAAAGNFVVKVVYLPDPQYQDLASTGPDTVVSSQLEPGVDPIAEAHRRGSILLVVRLGNIDLEAPNTPAMDAPSPYMPRPQQPMPGGPGGMGPQGGPQSMLPGMAGPGMGPMVPYGAMANQGMMPPPGMMPPGMMPPGMMPPGMMPPPGMGQPGPGSAPTLPTKQPSGAPGPLGQTTDDSGVKQGKFNPAKDAPLKSFSWPFGKKDDNQYPLHAD